MKAISLHQPWANLVAHGKKTLETRVWRTKHRGPILICSTLSVDKTVTGGWPLVPLGCAVAVAEIVDARPMIKDDEIAACISLYSKANVWVLQNIRRIEPIPVKGSLGVFDIDIDESQLVFI